MQDYIKKIIGREDLSFGEARQAMNRIMSGTENHSRIAAFLAALKSKGETAQEVAGFAAAMRDNCVKVPVQENNIIDVCGTGGDVSGTFNISTATAFVVAGAGVRVAKHGNRSISSKSGSADVLAALGVNIDLDEQQAAQAIEEIGIAFLFAPRYHPAMKHVAPVRRELGMKTVFNILGPLTNPAATKRQLIGTYNLKAAQIMAEAAAHLDMEKVCFVCTDDHLDEITLTGETEVCEYSRSEGVKNYTLTNDDFGYPKLELDQLKGSSAEHNAEILRDVFNNAKKTPAFYVTAANAAMGLYCAGFSENLRTCREAAEESLLSGKARQKLKLLTEFGERSR